MPSEYQQPVIHLYMAALHKVFTLPLVVAGIAVICALCAKNVKYGANKPPQSSTDQQEKSTTTLDPQKDIDIEQDDTNRTLDNEEIEEKKQTSIV